MATADATQPALFVFPVWWWSSREEHLRLAYDLGRTFLAPDQA